MRWGVGSGRCGTKSLAVQLGGLHEPSPKLVVDPLAEAQTIEVLKYRRSLDTPIIVDFKQSYVVHLIRLIDPQASFLWVVRNPVDTIASYVTTNPEFGLTAAISRWMGTNQKCLNLHCQKIYTEDLTAWENTSVDTRKLNPEQEQRVIEETSALWSAIQSV